MKKETRILCYDEDLNIEAFVFEGITQPFPSHTHEYYVIGLVERGSRKMICKGNSFDISYDDIIIFNPLDSHMCVQSDNESFYYKGVNISPKIMKNFAQEITGEPTMPLFSECVIKSDEIKEYILSLHSLILSDSSAFEKEELILLLLSRLIEQYAKPFLCTIGFEENIERVCTFVKNNCEEHITLKQMSELAGMSKSTLLRTFIKFRGITPYRYLQNVRINKAQELLKSGSSPTDAALESGFYDQSHLNNTFNKFLGFPISVYKNTFNRK